MEKMKWIKKGISALLALNMVLSSVPLPVFAVTEDNLCDHHTEHTAECGYVEAVEGRPCTHVHDEACGYAEPIGEVLCACTETDDTGALVHTEGCGYVAPVAGSDCTHAHDETCGYVEAVEGKPCVYECAECAAAEEADSGLVIDSVYAVGNGSADFGNWLNGESWVYDAESNRMTEVSDNIYEITYTNLSAADYKVKFAANGSEDIFWGGSYEDSGVETDALYLGPEIFFWVPNEGSDVTLELDLTDWDPATTYGAKFTITVIPPEVVPVCTCEDKCVEGSVNSDCAVCAEDVNGCTGREEETDLGYTYDQSTNTYTVYTADGLFAVAELVYNEDGSINITLAADIVLNENLADKVTVAEDGTVSVDASVREWTPLGGGAGGGQYSGTFDGGNHTITGLYCFESESDTYSGLIERLAPEGTVKNLKIRDFCLERSYSGAIAGRNEGKIIGCSISGTGIFNGSPELYGGQFGGIVCENVGQVTDCSISANLFLKGAGEFGGIAYSNGQDASIIGCSNSGTLTGTRYVCGIVSSNYGTVTGCSNSGTLTGTRYVCGIVSYNSGTVTGCSNSGTLTGTEYVGGIAGAGSGTVSGCYNTGTVTGTEYVGGIAGFADGPVSGCYNIGSIYSGGYSGGIVAFAYYGTFADCYYLDTCVKSGETGSSSADGITEKSAAQFASGEVAYLLNGDKSTITYRQNLGSDAAPSFTGGTVYRVTGCDGNTAYSNTNENIDHNWVNGTCTGCGAVCDHSGSTTKPTDNGNGTHSSTCAVCGGATEEHAFDENGSCVCGVNLFDDSDSTLTIDGTLGGKTEATEEDITVLVNKIKECLDQGITTITVTGEEPAVIEVDGIIMPAVSEAIYRLRGESYYGKIDLILPDVTKIVDQEFYDARALNSITLPKVTTVGTGAFYGCLYLKTITFGSVVTSINQKDTAVFHMVGADVDGCDLVLNCGQLQAEYTYRPDLENNVWFQSSSGDTTWKSITLTHSYGDWVSNGDGTHTRTCANDSTHIENGDCSGGTATCTTLAVCDDCGKEYGELAAHTPDTNGKCTVDGCGYQYAAKVGDSFYETIHKALRAAEENSGCTLTLLDDITLTSMSSTASYTNQGTFILDLNGKTLSSNKGTLNVLGSADLTIRDSAGGGKIISTYSNAIYQTGGKVTIESGTFEGTLDGVFLSGTSTLIVKGGTFTGSRAMITGFGSNVEIDLTAIDPSGLTLKNNGSGTFAPKLPEGYGMVGSDGKLLSSLSAEQSATVHKHEYKYTDLGDGNHQQACSCGMTTGEPAAHSTTAEDDKAATCIAPAYCSVCDSEYGDVDTTNHDSSVECVNGFCPNGCYEPATLNAEGFYEIFNAGQLYWFARQVNIAGDTAANGKLMADIDLENRTWYPIGLYNDIAEANGSPVQKQYAGTFDGNNHTVSNFTAIGNGSQGLFGYCKESQTQIKNLGVINATVSGWNAGAVAGYCANLTNCYAVGCTITGASDTNTQAVTISSVGGNNGATVITNCWAYNCKLIVGEGEENYVMHPVGGIRTSNGSVNNVQNCYYGEIVTVATFTSTTGATEKTEAQFASGEVAYLLGTAWGQTIGTDSYPVLGGDTVYRVDTCGAEDGYGYSNTNAPQGHNYDANGFCTQCGGYEMPYVNEEGVYEIANAGQLYWFAQQVNGGSYGLNAKLVNNITLNENLLNDSYGLNSGDFRTWTPMGDFFHGYSGTFDGQGYVISGLYIPSTNTIQGMFSVVTGTVKNVILADTYVQGAGQDGGLVGYLRGGTVSNCGFDGVVRSVASGGSAGSYTAGVVAYTYGGTIENCFATGKFHSEGDHANPVFAYADTNSGALTLTNNYYLENCSTDSTGTVNAVHCNEGVYATTEAQIASVTEEQILSGEVAYLLGGAWGQTIGTDSYPVLGGAKVYEIKVCEKSAYSNTEGDVPHDYVNGFCTAIPGEIHYQPALDSDSDGFFEIGNAGQMFWFANHINTVDRTASAVLTADIDLEGRPWTPIGSTGESSNNFRGTFDGQNHTIKGLYVEGGRAGLGFFGEVRTGTVKNFTIYGEVVANTEVNYVGGVFGSICGLNSSDHGLERNGATIQNITSYVDLTAKVHGIGMIGGFVGYANHQSLIENCAWYGTFDAGIYRVDTGAGGFIGKIQENTSEVTIRNCGAYGTIKTNYAKNSYNNTPTIYMGGFLSFSNTNAKTTLENCLFAGKFERGANLTDQAFLGAFGTLRSVNAIKNCYYLGDDGLEAVHSDSNLKPGSDNVKITGVTGEQLLSGEIAYKLGSAWGQTIGTDDYPILGGRKVYYGYADCKATEKTYANSPLAETEPVHSFNANGFCSVCDEYEPASDAEGDGYYDIDNAGKLYWFAAQVNGGNTAINGKLIENITVNENVLNANGEPNSGDFRAWTPIGKSGNSYTGTFDGNGKTISGLYFNDSTINYVGLFGIVSSGTVQNVGVIDSYLHGNKYVGGVVGYNSSGTVQNCYNTGSVSGTSYYVGGVVGYNSGTVTGCYNTGSVSGTYYVGGVVGWNSSGTVQNSYNTGSVSGTGYYVGGVVGDNSRSGTVKDCYNTGTVSGDQNVGGVVGYNSSSTVQNCYNTGSVSGDQNVGGVVGYNSGSIIASNCYYDSSVYSGNAIGNSSGTITNVLGKTTEQFASGEVAYLLNGDQSTIVFKQTIGTDAAPGFTGETVYAITNCDGTGTGAYSNTKTQLPHDYSNNNGFCTVCDAYEPATDSDSNGYYDIDNAGKLYWFAAQVNSGNTNINGELKANIVVNENVLKADGKLNGDGSEFRIWTPIGTEDNGYSGDFCGFDHTVSGLYFNDSNANLVGLFGYVRSGAVNHVGVIDSYFNGFRAVGGVVGCNEGTVDYAYNTGTVKGDGSVGGVVGDNYSTVKYAYNTGSVSGDFLVGGVVGYNYHTVEYAYNTGSVSGETNVGGVAGENFATVTNCYFDSTVYSGSAIGTNEGTATDVEGKTTEQFASGEVAYLLGRPFGQTIGTHSSPVLYGDKVYYGYTSCGDVQMVYTNDSKASTEKPEHTGEATYTDNGDGTHSASYSCCGTTVTEDHTYENGKCPCGAYDLWVAGEQITDSHLTVSGTTGTATYDPATDTLTLNGFDNDFKSYSFTDNEYPCFAAVYTISDLNVVLEGENSLFASGDGFIMGIWSDAALTIGGDGTLDACTIYSANGTTINGGTLNLAAETVFDGPSTTINGGNVNVHALLAVTFETLTVTGGRVVLENSSFNIGFRGTILIGEGMAVYDANGALIENPDFKNLEYALIRVPCDHTQATASYTWTEDPITTLTVTVSCTACGETFTGSTTDMDSIVTSDDGFTTTYTATVTLDGKDYTDSKIVSNEVTRVNITWGEMDFTYTDESGWNNPDTAWVQVANTGNTAVTVTYDYVTERTDITGSFFDGTATVTAPVAIDAAGPKKIWLRLDGRPGEALNNTTIGSVKLTIE